MPQIVASIVECYPFRRVGATVEFLLLRRRDDRSLGGTWQGVQGGVESGETAAQAALRELGEETGILPIAMWQLESVSPYFLAARDAVMLSPAFAAEAAPDAVVRLSHEHSAYRWLSADEARSAFLWPGQRRAIREILDEIIRPGPAELFLRIDLLPLRSAK